MIDDRERVTWIRRLEMDRGDKEKVEGGRTSMHRRMYLQSRCLRISMRISTGISKIFVDAKAIMDWCNDSNDLLVSLSI